MDEKTKLILLQKEAYSKMELKNKVRENDVFVVITTNIPDGEYNPILAKLYVYKRESIINLGFGKYQFLFLKKWGKKNFIS